GHMLDCVCRLRCQPAPGRNSTTSHQGRHKENIMRKTLLASAIAGACISQLAFAEVYDARALARGGTGMTMGEYNQALYNPAMLNRFDENDEFSFAINVGVIASDKDGFIDASEEIGRAHV